MFRVNEMMGNFSKEVAMFETEAEASQYIMDQCGANIHELEIDLNSDYYEIELENQLSYYSIEDDGRELLSEDKLTEMYDDMLDECYPEMFGMLPSRILHDCDNIQYSCGLNDFYDSISDSYYCEEME